jgi:hypothetical protein
MTTKTIAEVLRAHVLSGEDISLLSSRNWLLLYRYVRSNEWLSNLDHAEAGMFALFVAEAVENPC